MNAIDNQPVKIDIEEVIRSRNPKLLKRIPGFIVRYIKRILHQDEMNETLRVHKDKYGLDFVDAVLGDFGIHVETRDEENIPAEGRYIFAANHPLGGIESLTLMKVVGRHDPNIRFLVNDLLMHLKNFQPIFVPINKLGGQSKSATLDIEDTYASPCQILYFPAGMVSRKKKGVIADPEWKKSFIVKAVKHQRDIIPVHIEGKNSRFFYSVARIRSFFGIKANIEMFYLPNEMYKQKGKIITLTFGKPLSHKTFDNSRTPHEWALYVRNIVYSMVK
ncbi:MAG: 1-acyl-sn-glycerol-3-phosphate acyltransferase [Bacteroidota bacterium]